MTKVESAHRSYRATVLYTLCGILFGACFPVAALLWVFFSDGTLANQAGRFLSDAHENYPLLYMIDTAPLFLGLFAFLAGYRQDLLLSLNSRLGATVAERTRELHLLAMAFDTGLATMIVDASGHILRVNHAFTEVTGYAPHEVIGHNPRIFQSGLQDEAFYDELWRRLRHSGHWQGTLWNKRKDGHVYALWEAITAVSDNNGGVACYVAVFEDITEQKELEASRDRLLAVLENTPDFIAIGKVDGTMVYINRGGRQLVGLPCADDPLNDAGISHLVAGRFAHPQWAADKVAKEGFETAIREGVWKGETALLDQEGNEIPVSQIILAHRQSDGSVTHFSTIMRDISRQKQLEHQLRTQAERDSLTGISNRRRIDSLIDQAIYISNRYERVFSLAMLDIDHFKNVNDTYGHSVGDEVLVHFAKIVQRSLRYSDVVARWGGEEFMVLMPETGRSDVRKAAEKLRQTVLDEPFPSAGHITISTGVACYRPEETMDEILTRVDDALYQAKAAGRNRVVAL